MNNIEILIGPPGSGKSSYVRREINNWFGNRNIFILSTDDFWFDGFGQYKIDFSKINQAHKWNLERYLKSLDGHNRIIFVDNTNLEKKYIKSYAIPAIERKYKLKLVWVLRDKETSFYELYRRQTHKVPYWTLKLMYEKYWKLKNDWEDFCFYSTLSGNELIQKWLEE